MINPGLLLNRTVGQAVTFTAVVRGAAPGSGTPAGAVVFEDGGVGIGSATILYPDHCKARASPPARAIAAGQGHANDIAATHVTGGSAVTGPQWRVRKGQPDDRPPRACESRTLTQHQRPY
jgi:hypothetical protein